jgi:hypothetical protein
MPSKYDEIDLSGMRLKSIEGRESLVTIDDFTRPIKLTRSQADALLDSIPPILAGTELRWLLASLRKARESGAPRIWTMGAHSIKVGISYHLIALMEAGFITHLATNGAGVIHDTEIACFGHTSEDVTGTIKEGGFAVTKETGEIINASINRACKEKLGFGEAIGEDLLKRKAPHVDASISASCYKLGIPFTVHVAVGTDVNHIHPSINGAALGDASHRDFRIFTNSVSKLQGGVIVNLGSAVVLPVVIEKAVAVCQNLGKCLTNFDGYNLDFIRHYRSNLNPVRRAIESGGHGAHITGHHELNIPLLSAILLAE